jgi:hypothetical protein
MSSITAKTGNLNSLFNNVYEVSKFILEEETLMPQLVTRKNATTMAPRILSSYTRVTVGTVAEGSAATAGTQIKTADGTITPVIATAYEPLTEELMMTDPDGADDAVAKRIGRGMARFIDETGVGVFSSFTASAGTAGSALTVNHLAVAVAKLLAARNIGLPSGVLHPFQWHSVAGQTIGWTANPIAATASEAFNTIMAQYFGGIGLGAQWFLSNAIGTGTAAVAGVFHEEAIIYDVRTDYELRMEEQASTRSVDFYGLQRFNFGIDRNEAGVKVTATASAPS